jgi:hypothetical protein
MSDIVERLRTRNGRPDGFGLGLLCDEAAGEIERLREDSALLAWVLAHPETCAEVLQDAAAGEGEARALLRQRQAALDA